MKRLSAVESSRNASNQHELNGNGALRGLLGDLKREDVAVQWALLADDTDARVEADHCTWYDSRANNPNRNAEWRLYYHSEPAIFEGDLLCAMERQDDPVLRLVVARPGSSWESQLLLLFGKPDVAAGRFFQGTLESVSLEMAGVAAELLSLLGWQDTPVESETSDIEAMFHRFGDHFPTTREFSEFARSRVSPDPTQPDALLLAWWEMEEGLFRAFEERGLRERLKQSPPFAGVEEFIRFSLSVQNRRKSRAGHALENHVDALFRLKKIRAERGARTEGNRRPDFLLPGEDAYRDANFPDSRLLMLGAKTTCKDRWRQVLDEAARIRVKHLLTLEAAISADQLKQMKESGVVLVAPRSVISTYPSSAGVIAVSDFLDLAARNQDAAN